jgi:hypothetical protein
VDALGQARRRQAVAPRRPGRGLDGAQVRPRPREAVRLRRHDPARGVLELDVTGATTASMAPPARDGERDRAGPVLAAFLGARVRLVGPEMAVAHHLAGPGRWGARRRPAGRRPTSPPKRRASSGGGPVAAIASTGSSGRSSARSAWRSRRRRRSNSSAETITTRGRPRLVMATGRVSRPVLPEGEAPLDLAGRHADRPFHAKHPKPA